MKLSEQLEAAFALIDSEDKWCKETYSVNEDGETVDPESDSACEFCSAGAIYRALNIPLKNDLPNNLINALQEFTKGATIEYFNDTHTYAEVREVWLKSIAKAKEEEK